MGEEGKGGRGEWGKRGRGEEGKGGRGEWGKRGREGGKRGRREEGKGGIQKKKKNRSAKTVGIAGLLAFINDVCHKLHL